MSNFKSFSPLHLQFREAIDTTHKKHVLKNQNIVGVCINFDCFLMMTFKGGLPRFIWAPGHSVNVIFSNTFFPFSVSSQPVEAASGGSKWTQTLGLGVMSQVFYYCSSAVRFCNMIFRT
jgi:phenylalanyl-tRNA synthetase alpha subunit